MSKPQPLVEKIMTHDGKIMNGLFDLDDQLVQGEIDYSLCSASSSQYTDRCPVLCVEHLPPLHKSWVSANGCTMKRFVLFNGPPPAPINDPISTTNDITTADIKKTYVKCLNITDGYWENGKLVKGEVTFANGDVWEGDWNNEGDNGFLINGKKRFASGAVFEGEFINGLISKGKIMHANGNNYEGEFNDAGLLIKGKKTLEHGCVLEGEFNDGQFINGKYTHKKNYKISNDMNFVSKGEWVNGTLKKGKTTFEDGDVFEGEWDDGILKKGKKTYKRSRDVYEGEFNNCNLIKGKMTFKNGDVYEGEFNDDDGNKLMKGKKILANGNVVIVTPRKSLFVAAGQCVRRIFTRTRAARAATPTLLKDCLSHETDNSESDPEHEKLL
jgi:hypothetical protein